MATSGSKNFALTRNDIINAAFRKLGVFDKGETPTASETADAAQALNVMINEWAGVWSADIFLRADLTLFIQKGQQSYRVGPTGDHITASYVETTLASTAVAAATVLSLVSTAGISDGDYIGIKTDDETVHWTLVSGAPVGLNVTLATGLDSVASTGSKVYVYTEKAYRPRSIAFPYRRDRNGYDTPMDLIGEGEYRGIADKGLSSVPNQLHYRAALDNGTLFVWPTGDGDTDKISFVGHYYPDDFDAAADNAQFPIEWSSALIWGLAAELAPEYGVPEREIQRTFNIASSKLSAALDADHENASVMLERGQ